MKLKLMVLYMIVALTLSFSTFIPTYASNSISTQIANQSSTVIDNTKKNKETIELESQNSANINNPKTIENFEPSSNVKFIYSVIMGLQRSSFLVMVILVIPVPIIILLVLVIKWFRANRDKKNILKRESWKYIVLTIISFILGPVWFFICNLLPVLFFLYVGK